MRVLWVGVWKRRVWGVGSERESIMVESRDYSFFEDGLPPPTHRLATQADDSNDLVVQHPVDSPVRFVPRTVPVLTPSPPPTTPQSLIRNLYRLHEDISGWKLSSLIVIPGNSW